MLRLLIPTGSGYTWVEHAPPAPFPDEFLWADLFEPTPEEEKAVESLLTVDVPTRDEMREIETSNRLYEENGAVYMTATVGSKLDSPSPESSAQARKMPACVAAASAGRSAGNSPVVCQAASS
jgi:magnesium transporter